MAENWEKWCGQVIQGKFRLEDYLGGSDRDGVFLASSSEQGTPKVAVKLVVAKPANADIQISLWKQIANLSHLHIARVFQSGRWEIDGIKLLYVVTEYAEEDLAQILPQRSLTPDETKEMLGSVLDALGYLHDKGFVHGHLTPSHIQVVNDQLKLSSDGIMKINEPSNRTKRGAYDPPEIATMTTSPAGDIWSLGMVLVETLTQKLPAADVYKIDDPKQKEPMVSAFIPEPFQEIARNCLRNDPERRWTVSQIAAQLQNTTAYSLATPEVVTAPREPSGKRGFLILLTAAVLILVIVAGVELRDSHSASQQAPSIAVQQPENQPPAASRLQPASQPKSQPMQKAAEVKTPTSVKTGSHAPIDSSFPGVIHQVIPEASPSARNTVQGKVRVRVRVAVDPSGNVSSTTFDSHGPSNYFAGLAQRAAEQWKFVPAQMNGQNVPSEWVLKFAFGRKATEVYPVPANPK